MVTQRTEQGINAVLLRKHEAKKIWTNQLGPTPHWDPLEYHPIPPLPRTHREGCVSICQFLIILHVLPLARVRDSKLLDDVTSERGIVVTSPSPLQKDFSFSTLHIHNLGWVRLICDYISGLLDSVLYLKAWEQVSDCVHASSRSQYTPNL